MERGNIAVQTENIFPIIKKFLYSDHEIFLRELISNAVDASQKLYKLSSLGQVKGEIGELNIEVRIDKDKNALIVSDNGIGMTADEVKKYINQIALSGAREFLEQYESLDEGKNIIGKFGLGFYSSFMVADKVELVTRSYQQDAKGVTWACEGDPEFTLAENEKKERGTDIILYINEENKEFLEEHRVNELLNKYCKFLPIPIKFGTKEEKEKEGDKETTVVKDNIVNNTSPAWTRKPADLTDDDYRSFYRELYPFGQDPLFWIHLNVDYPFNLTGILYFPTIRKNFEIQRDKIQLYSNQVFVTEEVKEIVPEWLTLLHGVIDSPDIPLNVSRSYLQSDPNVKKINSYITRKVAEKLEEIFKNEREDFEKKWEHISVITKYGMMTDDKFYERISKICLFQNIDDKYFTFEEYREKVKPAQTDNTDKVVYVYTSNPDEQDYFIQAAVDRGYDILKTDTVIDSHFISFLEDKLENTTFTRVDADTAEDLIKKDEKLESVLTEKQEERLKGLYSEVINNSMVEVTLKGLSPEDSAIAITKPEITRRMREMSALSGNNYMSGLPEHYNVVVNSNHPAAMRVLNAKGDNRKHLVRQLYDLALLSQGMLKGTELTGFLRRSVDLLTK